MSTVTSLKKASSRLTVLLAVAIMLLASTAVVVVGAGRIDLPEGSATGGPGGIAGVVKDIVNGSSIKSVAVKFFDGTNHLKSTGITTGQGNYINATPLVNGPYSVAFNHKDYEVYNISGKTVATGKTYWLNVSLQPFPSVVTGVVQDLVSGAPVQGATVTLKDGDLEPTMPTPANGTYKFTTTARSGYIKVDALINFKGYTGSTVNIPINFTVNMPPISLERATGHLNGKVTGANGAIAGANVILRGWKTQNMTTNATGGYSFDAEWGQYTLAIVKDGYYLNSIDVGVTAAQTVTKDMSMRSTPELTAEVFGYVKDSATHIPIDGAMVCFVDNDAGGQLCMKTGVDGYFHFNIYPGYFEAQFNATGYKPYKTTVSLTKGDNKNVGDILIQVLPAMNKKLSGKVKFGTTGIPNAMVSIYDGDVMVTYGMSAMDGNYSIMTYTGTFTVKATAGGYFDKTLTGIVVAGDTTQDIDMIQVPAMKDKVFGYIMAAGKNPIKGASVSLVDRMAGHSWFTVKADTTDGGYYTFNIYDGSFLFIVKADGFNADMKKVTIGADYQQDMLLNASGQEPLMTTVTFKDWQNMSLVMEDHMTNNVKLLRYTIDSAFGNGDGTVTGPEVDAWVLVEQAKGPQAKDTKDLLLVDGTAYGIVDTSFMVKAKGAEGDIMSTDVIILTKAANFTSMATITALKNHTIKYNVTFDTKFTDNSTDLTVPAGWEARHIDSEYVSVSGTFMVSLKPPLEKKGLNYELVELNVTGNTPPAADAGKNRTIKVDVNTTFDASSSADDFGISNYSWNFGDGKTGYGVNLNHKYALTGVIKDKNFTVSLTVKDTAGVTNSTKIWVLVDGEKPTADFTATGSKNGTATAPVANEDQEKIVFNASTSKDNIKIANYTWNFGDGHFGYGVLVNHTWVQPGAFNVTLNVTDAAGWWSNKTVKVTIRDVTHPYAIITFNGANSVYLEDKTNQTFNGSRSTDNVAVVSYNWDFADGTIGTGQQLNHSYTKVGKFNVTLNVSDAAGNTNKSEAILITVQKKPTLPDLMIDSIKFENAASFKIGGSDIHDGDKVKITIAVKNLGDAAIDASNTNTEYSVQFTYGSHIITIVHKLTVAAHGTATVVAYFPVAKQGKYKLCAEADPENRIPEKDESNNKKCTGDVTVGYSWTLMGGIAAGIIIVFVLAGVGYYMSKKASEERREKLRQRKKMR